jgi:hypothetical protein
MTIDEQLKQIKTANGKSLYEIQVRRARATALVLAAAIVVGLIFLVFAFVQKAAADTAREEAIKNEIRAQALEVELHKCQSK